MADALCGPSNALQTFQKRTSVDRTLQQDRLISRHSPLQVCDLVADISSPAYQLKSFRTSDRNAGILDPEFEAFQAAQPSLQPFTEHSFLHSQPQHSRFQHNSYAISPQTSAWAADFQRLQITSEAGPSRQSANQQIAHQQVPSGPLDQEHGSRTIRQMYSPAERMEGYQPQYGGLSNGLGHGLPVQYMHQHHQADSSILQTTDAQDLLFDEAAFERAFDAAQERIIAEERQADPNPNFDASMSAGGPPTIDVYPHCKSVADPFLENT
jgi:hypothetical protein